MGPMDSDPEWFPLQIREERNELKPRIWDLRCRFCSQQQHYQHYCFLPHRPWTCSSCYNTHTHPPPTPATCQCSFGLLLCVLRHQHSPLYHSVLKLSWLLLPPKFTLLLSKYLLMVCFSSGGKHLRTGCGRQGMMVTTCSTQLPNNNKIDSSVHCEFQIVSWFLQNAFENFCQTLVFIIKLWL